MAEAAVEQIDPAVIRRNPENPRLIFPQEGMNLLLDSISKVGIQVPVTLYKEGKKYFLIDGERRWRCASKLNLPHVPAIIQPKPPPLENLLIMFNIHNVRANWELPATAKALQKVQRLLEEQNLPASPKDLAAITGLSQGMVRDAFTVLSMPKKYQRMLLDEALKPKSEQRITPYLFLEVYKALRVSQRYVPELFKEYSESKFVEAMVQKYVRGVVDSVVAYRQVSKIARAERAGVSKSRVLPILVELVSNEDYSVENAYHDSVEEAYMQRGLASHAKALQQRLREISGRSKLDPSLSVALGQLRKELDRLLGT